MFSAFQFHKSIGFLILALSIARVMLRAARPRPKEVTAGPVGRFAAKAVHFLLYTVMIAGPVTGWMVVSTAKINVPTMLFGAIPVPHLPIDWALHGFVEQSHVLLAWMGAGLILLHVAGAISHHFPLRAIGAEGEDDVIGRMIPLKSGDGWKLSLAAGAASLLFSAFAAPWLLFVGNPSSAMPKLAGPNIEPAVASSSPALVSPKKEQTAVPQDPSALSEKAVSTKQPSGWMVDGGGTLGFSASMNGAAIVGRFERWSAEISFDPEALDASRIVVRIPLLSANTGDSSRDEMLKGPNFFGSAGSNATFRSDRIEHISGNRYTARGTLTMNGTSRPANIRFNLTIDGNRANVTGSSELDRTAFDIGTGEWSSVDQIAAKVGVNFAFTATRTK